MRFLTAQINAQAIEIRSYDDTIASFGNRAGPQVLDELEHKLQESEARVSAMNGSYSNLEKRALELEEARQVLRETDVFFKNASSRSDQVQIRASLDEPNAPLLGDVEDIAAEEGGLGNFDLE